MKAMQNYKSCLNTTCFDNMKNGYLINYSPGLFKTSHVYIAGNAADKRWAVLQTTWTQKWFLKMAAPYSSLT